LSTARRFFLYAAALIGLLILLASLLVLSGQTIRLWSSGLAVTEVPTVLARGSPGWIGLGLAGLVIWALGWLPANGAARQLTLAGASERASNLRKAYLYTGQLVTLAVGLIEAGLMVAGLLRRALDLPAGDAALWPVGVLTRAAGLLIALLFWGHLRWVTVRDGDFGHESGRAANWRRAYLYMGALAGFSLVIGGAIGYVRAMFGLASSALLSASATIPALFPAATAWREPIVWSVTALVVGIPVAILIWSTAGRLAAGAPTREYGALSRVTLLHAGLLFGAAVTLASVAYLLWEGMLLATGVTMNTYRDWPTVMLMLACLPVGIVSWLAFASAARHTVALSLDAPRAIAICRFTLYLLAAGGLAAFWIGLGQLLRVILAGVTDTAASAPSLPAQLSLLPSSGRERFSLGAALVLVGAPAWWGYWWPRQAQARQSGAQGTEERSSWMRKAYLYGVIAAAAVALAISLLGAALQAGRGSFANGVGGALAGGVVAVFWLIAHLLVLRGDRRWTVRVTAEPSTPVVLAPGVIAEADSSDAAGAPGARSYRREDLAALAATTGLASTMKTPKPVVVVDGGDGSLGVALLAALRSALPEIPLWPLGLNSNAQAAMLAVLGDDIPPAASPDALAQAAAIVGPSDILLPGGLQGEVSTQVSALLAASPARLVLLPPRDPRLRWVAAPQWPDERWIENAVIEVANVV
jgi:Domain of unknown function (DUF5671)/Domain of unknown function (DUF3842)